MLEKVYDVPAEVDAVRAVGTVSKGDYETVIEPLVEDARKAGRRIRLLYEFSPDFRAFTPAAGLEDIKVGIGAMRQIEGYAVVSDTNWIRTATRLMGFLMTCPVRVFWRQHRAEALRWLATLPEGPGAIHYLRSEVRVLVVKVTQPLRAQDFDALAKTMDSQLETGDKLAGLVVHARRFLGWENLASLLRHVRFVRDHRRKVRKIALAADTRLARLMPHLVNRFVHAEVRRFGYDELDDAITWAASPPGRRGTTRDSS